MDSYQRPHSATVQQAIDKARAQNAIYAAREERARAQKAQGKR